MSVDLVVSGRAGTATRTTPRDRVRMCGTIVDEWRLQVSEYTIESRPLAVNVVNMSVIEVTGFMPEMVLLLTSVNGPTRVTCEWLSLPVALAVHVHAADLMPADDYDHARVVARHLARAAVDGTLPITPGLPDYARLWGVATRTLCALTGGGTRALAAVGAPSG